LKFVLAGFGLFSFSAWSQPPADLMSQMDSSWGNTASYCGNYVLAVYGERNVVVTRGRRCVEPGERILTETEGPLGPVVDIRTKEDAWYYDPAHPAVLHLRPIEGGASPVEKPGEGLGNWVKMMKNAKKWEALEDVSIQGRLHWRILLPKGDTGNEMVFLVDAEYHLPTAMELRQKNRPLLTMGFTGLEINPELPDRYFKIRPLVNVPRLEIQWDPSQSIDATIQERVRPQ
jgi:outer membrane lipoprotein-sorting protein